MDANVYTLEINKLDPVYKKINKLDSPYAGKEVLVLKGSYTIVDDEKYSGRKLWNDFWTPYEFALQNLKRQMVASGVIQQDGESLSDYARQFAQLNPPARIQVPVDKEVEKKDPDGGPKNHINFRQAKPAS